MSSHSFIIQIYSVSIFWIGHSIEQLRHLIVAPRAWSKISPWIRILFNSSANWDLLIWAKQTVRRIDMVWAKSPSRPDRHLETCICLQAVEGRIVEEKRLSCFPPSQENCFMGGVWSQWRISVHLGCLGSDQLKEGHCSQCIIWVR